MLPRAVHIAVFLAVGLLIAGCAKEETIPTGQPPGWDGTADRWWRTDVDTTGAFRNLERMRDMGIAGSNVLSAAPTGNAETDREMVRLKVVQLVKESLIELFRNQPEIVDSLFNRYVVPKMQNLGDLYPESNLSPLVKQNQKDAYRLLTRHFRRPVTVLKLVKDIPVPVPDSLHDARFGGTVMMQVAVNKEGIPYAIERIESAHPVLDAIAMRATTQMRWQPAYLLTGGRSVPVASWARFKVKFGQE